MLAICFENECGRLWFSGGGSSPLRLLAAEGLGLGGKECNVTGYVGQPGQVLLSEKDTARVITLSFDVAVLHLREELSRLMRILYHPGRLSVISGNRRRVIDCRCTDFEEPERHGRELTAAVIQLTCDSPYFTDEAPRQISLFQRRDLVRHSFSLPCVFTERISRAVVTNAGDVCAEPVFSVYHAAPNEAAVAALDSDYGLVLINHTTGQKIELAYKTEPGETVTLDIPGRLITSDVAGDITHTLSQDSYLSDFWLTVGVNDVEAVNYNTAARIGVVMRYDNRYVEAIW